MDRPCEGLLREFYEYWDAKRGSRAMPSRADMDPIDIPRLLPYVFLVDVLDEGADFRYRLVGGGIHTHVGSDLTGRRLSEVVENCSQEDLLDFYREVLHGRAPCRRRLAYTTPTARLTRYYDALVAPLSPDGEGVDMLFGIAVYEGV